MVLGHVERGEIIPLGLDLGPLGDGEAEVRENLGELIHHLAHRVDAALRGLGRGKRQVELLGREPPIELGIFERGLAAGQRIGDRFAQRVDLGRFGGARIGVHRPQRLQLGGDFARFAEHPDAQRLDRRQVGRACDFIQDVCVRRHVEALAGLRRKMQSPVVGDANERLAGAQP